MAVVTVVIVFAVVVVVVTFVAVVTLAFVVYLVSFCPGYCFPRRTNSCTVPDGSPP